MIWTSFQESNISDIVFNGLKANDSKAIVKHFNSTVNLVLKGEDRVSSKFQAELLLFDFFKSNRISSIKLKSSGGGKQGSSYFVYSIQVGKEDLQVIVKFMEIKGEASIIKFKIY